MLSEPRQDFGCGLVALIAGVIGVLIGFATEYDLFRWGVVGLFLLGAFNCLAVGKRWSAIGYFLEALGFIIGFYLLGRWGMLIGLVVACIVVTPFINKNEYGMF